MKWYGAEKPGSFCSTRTQTCTCTHTHTHMHRATQRQGQYPPECSLLLCLWKIYTEVISSAILSTSLTQEGFKEVVSVSAFCDDCVPVWRSCERACLRVYIKHDHPGAFFVLLLRNISAPHRAILIIASELDLSGSSRRHRHRCNSSTESRPYYSSFCVSLAATKQFINYSRRSILLFQTAGFSMILTRHLLFSSQDTHTPSLSKWVTERDKKKSIAFERTPSANWVNFRILCEVSDAKAHHKHCNPIL